MGATRSSGTHRARHLHLSDVMTGANNLARGTLLGLIGGLLVTNAMSLAHRVANVIGPKTEASPASREKDSTVKVASAVTRQVGYDLPEDQEPRAGSIVHYAFGASVGALYGAAAEIVPRITALVGLPFGVVVGIVAKFLMPGRDPGGFILTVLLGIAGALIGGYLGRAIGLYREGDPVGFIMAVVGSIALLLLYRVIAGRPRRV